MPLSGSNLGYFTKNTTINGFNQKVQVDTGGNVKIKYVILDTNNKGSQLYQTYMVDLTSEVLQFAGKSINFPGGLSPSPDSSCWFEKNAVCTGGKMFCFGTHIQYIVNMDVCVDVFYCHVLYLSILNCHIIKLPVFIIRCRGYLHHCGVFCHLDSGCRRAQYNSLCQVQSTNPNWFTCTFSFHLLILFFWFKDDLWDNLRIRPLFKWNSYL